MPDADRDRREWLATITEEWLAHGTSTRELIVPERERCEWGVRSAIEAAGTKTHSMIFIWVQSPMAGVLASAAVGFALDQPMAVPINEQLTAALATGSADAKKARHIVDNVVWRARKAVHARISRELKAPGPEWDRWAEDIGNRAWYRVWETVGDPLYSQGWEQEARRSRGLFEQNLKPWADAMVDGQFGAGAVAQLDAMTALDGVDTSAFDGVRRLAGLCGWWWPYEVGAVLCEPPSRFEVDGNRVRLEFRDGWTVQT